MGDDCLNQMMVTGEVYSLSLSVFLLLCVFEKVLFSILEGFFFCCCFF